MSIGISEETPGLFDWVPAPPRGRGRPPYVWTREKSNRLMVLFTVGHTQKTAAPIMGCDVKTLRKVFSRECQYAVCAEEIITSGVIARMLEEAEGGNVAAGKTAIGLLQAHKNRRAADRMAAPVKVERKGKKQVAQEAAWDAGKGDDEWGPLLKGDSGAALPN